MGFFEGRKRRPKDQQWKESPASLSLEFLSLGSVWRKTCNGRITVGFIGAVLGFFLLI